MKYLPVLIFVSLLFSTNCFAGGELFTWKDAEGGLHITDVRPPDGAEIVDVTPSNIKPAKEVLRERQIREEEIRQEQIRQAAERKRLEEEAAAARVNDDADAARRKAEEIAKAKEEDRERRARARRRRSRRHIQQQVSAPEAVANY